MHGRKRKRPPPPGGGRRSDHPRSHRAGRRRHRRRPPRGRRFPRGNRPDARRRFPQARWRWRWRCWHWRRGSCCGSADAHRRPSRSFGERRSRRRSDRLCCAPGAAPARPAHAAAGRRLIRGHGPTACSDTPPRGAAHARRLPAPSSGGPPSGGRGRGRGRRGWERHLAPPSACARAPIGRHPRQTKPPPAFPPASPITAHQPPPAPPRQKKMPFCTCFYVQPKKYTRTKWRHFR